MRTQNVLFLIICISLMCGSVFADNGMDLASAPTSTACWVSDIPEGGPVSVIGDADGSGDRISWFTREGPPTTNLKFILKFNSGSPIVKEVQQFRNINGGVVTPFSFPYWFPDLTFGQANVTIKDDFNSCKTQVQLVDNGFESGDVPQSATGGSTINSVVVTSGIDTIDSVIVSIRVQMAYDSDMIISLIGPDATTVVLMGNEGGAGDNAGTGFFHGQRTVFDDAAATNITATSPPYVGTFKPENPLTPFVGKTGAGANGTWTLRIQDTFGLLDDATLVNWALIINDNS